MRVILTFGNTKDLTSGKDYYDVSIIFASLQDYHLTQFLQLQGCLDITHAGDYITVSWN
jgi:hypothetical protein